MPLDKIPGGIIVFARLNAFSSENLIGFTGRNRLVDFSANGHFRNAGSYERRLALLKHKIYLINLCK
jgi:hypothetical protein